MKIKNCFLDVETTGLSEWKNGIWQLAGIIEIDGGVVEKFNFKMNIFPNDMVHPDVTEKFGVRAEVIAEFSDPKDVFKEFTALLEKYVDKFDKNDKMNFLAYNSPFDNRHVRQWFKKNSSNFFGSYFFAPDICIMRLAKQHMLKEGRSMTNFKLETVADAFHVDLPNAHDAMSDIEASFQVYKIIRGE